MVSRISAGDDLPYAQLAFLKDGAVATTDTVEVFAGFRSVVIGVPGAFTPVCTEQHVPDFVRNAPKLRQAGFQKLVCIAPNDPFVIDSWRKHVDPAGTVAFYADGNLDFTRRLGLERLQRDLFLGLRSERYMLVLDGLRVRHVRVEPTITLYSCVRSSDALDTEYL